MSKHETEQEHPDDKITRILSHPVASGKDFEDKLRIFLKQKLARLVAMDDSEPFIRTNSKRDIKAIQHALGESSHDK